MSTYVFALSILPGKTEDLKKYIREMNATRREEYWRSNEKIGLDIKQYWLQHLSQGDLLLVRMETDNPTRVLEHAMKSTDSFDTWFREKIVVECLGFDPSGPMPPLNEMINDYRSAKSSAKMDEKVYQESRKK